MRRLIFYLALAVTSGCASNNHKRKLDFLIDWQAEPTYLGIYYARAIGNFSRLGLQVSIIQSQGANQAINAVASGHYMIGTASGGATVLATNNGAEVVSLGVLYPAISTVVYGLSPPEVSKPADLAGRRIGIYPSSITKNEFDAFVRENHLNQKKMKIVSLAGPDVPLLLAGRVDAVLHYAEMSPILMERAIQKQALKGKKVFSLKLKDWGTGGYGLNIVTSRDTYRNQPELMRKLAEAAEDGYRAGCREPAKAVGEFLREFPSKDPKYVRLSWSLVCQFVGTNPGVQTEAGWRDTIELYRSLGLLKKPLDPKSILP